MPHSGGGPVQVACKFLPTQGLKILLVFQQKGFLVPGGGEKVMCRLPWTPHDIPSPDSLPHALYLGLYPQQPMR